MRVRLSDATWPTWRDTLRCYNHHHHYYFDYYYYYYCYLATLAEERARPDLDFKAVLKVKLIFAKKKEKNVEASLKEKTSTSTTTTKTTTTTTSTTTSTTTLKRRFTGGEKSLDDEKKRQMSWKKVEKVKNRNQMNEVFFSQKWQILAETRPLCSSSDFQVIGYRLKIEIFAFFTELWSPT